MQFVISQMIQHDDPP